MIKKFDKKKLVEKSKIIRKNIISNSSRNKIPHLGSCLSVVDILVFIYFYASKINKTNFKNNNRDRIVLSKGHAAPSLYFVLQEANIINDDVQKKYAEKNSFYGEHPPTPGYINGIEAATGSLGHGLPMLLGFAVAAKWKKLKSNFFAIIGDGESNEGTIWEAAMFASSKKLNNVFVFLDFNKWQATDRSMDVLHLDSMEEKWRSFGWETIRINGHDYNELKNANDKFIQSKKPFIAICDTIKGKGVSFMEDDNNWHYRIPTKEELEASIEMLR
jgi:transketolase